MLVGTGMALIFPFLTQSLVDRGIVEQNIGFVEMILVSQLALFAGSFSIELIRNWLMLHMNSRINISMISDFLAKLMRLPIRFFDTKHIGDIKQRIGDHSRVQSFLTGSALATFFSMINLVVFTIVLAIYSLKILLVFLLFSCLGVLWITFFLKRRKQLDYIRFQRLSANENMLFELITGMQEIKLNNCETVRRWNWERLQAKLFDLNIKSLALGQTQQIGSTFFNQLKNILISYLSAREVIRGNMTLGMMMSVSYIVGQINSPIQLLLGFIQSAQDAKISLDRLSEIHEKDDEDLNVDSANSERNIRVSPNNNHSDSDTPNEGILLKDVSFQYEGTGTNYALKNINLHIPKGKTTAIVGMSGSGKTTLIKLLLKFYEPTRGHIMVDKTTTLEDIGSFDWRSRCGSVMQDGYIFSDTIANNISLSDDEVNHQKLHDAITVANIKDFIEDLPMGYHTQIGLSGNGISAGQKQRILIARAVYKNPDYLFFDEATNMLDANNESVIVNNLSDFFLGKTVVVIAHRLSTVKNADLIVVMENSQIVESGTHQALIKQRGKYYELVKNQLEAVA